MLLSGWSPLVLLFTSLSDPLPSLWRLFRVQRSQLVSPSPSCAIVFSVREQFPDIYLFFGFFYFHSVAHRDVNVHHSAGSIFVLFFCFVLFCFLLSQVLVVWPRLGDPFKSQNPREVRTSYFPAGQRLGSCPTTLFPRIPTIKKSLCQILSAGRQQ